MIANLERPQRVTSKQFSLIYTSGSFGAVSGHFLDRISTPRIECLVAPAADVGPGEYL
jgi:hypothetical protein